jgi:hypothetical protein
LFQRETFSVPDRSDSILCNQKLDRQATKSFQFFDTMEITPPMIAKFCSPSSGACGLIHHFGGKTPKAREPLLWTNNQQPMTNN